MESSANKPKKVVVEEDGSPEESGGRWGEAEIEAKAVKNNILIRVHCRREKGILANLLGQLETMNMAVVNTSVNPFGDSALDITVIAEMEKGFNLTAKEVVTVLRAEFGRMSS